MEFAEDPSTYRDYPYATRKKITFQGYERRTYKLFVQEPSLMRFHFKDMGSRNVLLVGRHGGRPSLTNYDIKMEVIPEGGRYIAHYAVKSGALFIAIYNDYFAESVITLSIRITNSVPLDLDGTSRLNVTDTEKRASPHSPAAKVPKKDEAEQEEVVKPVPKPCRCFLFCPYCGYGLSQKLLERS